MQHRAQTAVTSRSNASATSLGAETLASSTWCPLDKTFGSKTVYFYENMKMADFEQDFLMAEATYLSYRKIVVDWMLQISDFFHVDISTGHMAVLMLDRLAPDTRFTRSEWQLIAICCLRLAAKYCEREEDVPCLSKMEKIAQERLSHSEVLQFEIWIMSRLSWRLDIYSHSHFLGLFYNKIDVAYASDEFSAMYSFFDIFCSVGGNTNSASGLTSCSSPLMLDGEATESKRRKNDKQQSYSRKKSRIDVKLADNACNNLSSSSSLSQESAQNHDNSTMQPVHSPSIDVPQLIYASLASSSSSGEQLRQMSNKIKSICLIISRMCLREVIIKSFPASIVAASICCMARLIAGVRTPWRREMVDLTGFSINQLFCCLLLIDKIINATCKRANQSYATMFLEALGFDSFNVSKADLVSYQQPLVVDAVSLKLSSSLSSLPIVLSTSGGACCDNDDNVEMSQVVLVVPFVCDACCTSSSSSSKSSSSSSSSARTTMKTSSINSDNNKDFSIKNSSSKMRRTRSSKDDIDKPTSSSVVRKQPAIERLQKASLAQNFEFSDHRAVIECYCNECGQFSTRIKRMGIFLGVVLVDAVGGDDDDDKNNVVSGDNISTNDSNMSVPSSSSDSNLSILSNLSASLLDSFGGNGNSSLICCNDSEYTNSTAKKSTSSSDLAIESCVIESSSNVKLLNLNLNLDDERHKLQQLQQSNKKDDTVQAVAMGENEDDSMFIVVNDMLRGFMDVNA